MRVIGAFPSALPRSVTAAKVDKKPTTAALETVVYKKLGDIDIHANVYYPRSSDTPAKKMPIGEFTS